MKIQPISLSLDGGGWGEQSMGLNPLPPGERRSLGTNFKAKKKVGESSLYLLFKTGSV
jgi:hypothetical protein